MQDFYVLVTQEKSPGLGRFGSPAPVGFYWHFWEFWEEGKPRAGGPWSGVGSSLCLGPGDGHEEHEFGSHLRKAGATGAAPGAGPALRRGWGWAAPFHPATQDSF